MHRTEFIRKPYIRAIVTDKNNITFGYDVRLRGGGPEVGINGTFYWHHNGKRYTNGILIDNGKIVGESSAHSWKGQPDSILVFDDLSSHKGLWASDYNVKNAISGAGLSPNLYDPRLEGYIGSYADVWRFTYHNVLGFKKDRVWLLCVKGGRDKLLEIGREFDNAILLDGGHAGNLTTPTWGYGNKYWKSQNAILIKEV
jgi:hypothetical protein